MAFRNVSNKKNITIGIALSFVTLLFSLLLHIFYTRFLVNSVGDTQYGVYSYAVSLTNWLTVLSSAVFSSYIKFVTIKQKDDGEDGVKKANSLFLLLFIVFDIIAIAFLSIVFILLFSGVIHYQDENLLISLLLVSGIQVVLSIPSNIFSLYITFKGKHIWIKLINLISTILPPLISIPFLINGSSIVSVLVIQCSVLVGTYILNFCFAVFHLKQPFKIGKDVFDKTFMKQVAVFSLFMILVEVVDKLNATSDQIILGSIENGSYVHLVTVYQLSLSFSDFFGSLSLAIVTVFIPTIHDSVVNGQREKTDKIFSCIYTLQMFVLLLFFGGFLSCGREFIHLWKPDHPEIFLFASILLFIRIVPLSQNASYEIQKAKNQFYFRSIINFIFAIVNVAISVAFLFILGFENGIYACLIGTVFSTIISKWFLISRYNRKKVGLDMKKYWLSLLKGFAAASFSFAVAVLIKKLLFENTSSIVRFLVAGSIYTCFFVLLFWLLFSEDLVRTLYILSKKSNPLLLSGKQYMKKGCYRINAALDTLYMRRADAKKISKSLVSSKGLPFYKKLFSVLYLVFSKGNKNDYSGDVIYRSKNKTHIFDIESKKHYIIYDNTADLLKELKYRSLEYPYSSPKILSFDKTRNCLCEQLLNEEEEKNKNIFDIIQKSLLNKKYQIVQNRTINEYISSYKFKNVEIGDFIRKQIFSSLNENLYISLCPVHGDFAPGNVILSDGELITIDWEMAGLAPFYYDFIHYLMSQYIRTSDNEGLRNYFAGHYDDFLKKFFKFNNNFYNSSLKHVYYYICLITRLALSYEKDGFQFENMIKNDKIWLNE